LETEQKKWRRERDSNNGIAEPFERKSTEKVNDAAVIAAVPNDLLRVVHGWNELSPETKAAILLLVQAGREVK